MEVQNTSEKSEKIRAKSRKLDEDAMLCNGLIITKAFLAFLRTSKRRNRSKLSKKVFFALFREKLHYPMIQLLTMYYVGNRWS